jgi:hypothetical protein
VNNYPVTFDLAYPSLYDQLNEGVDLNSAIIQTFLIVLAKVPDTFIARKVGLAKLWESLGKQVEYMNKVVSDLQDYARPIEPKIFEVNLRDLVVDTLSSMTIPPNIKVSLMIDERFHRVIIGLKVYLPLICSNKA